MILFYSIYCPHCRMLLETISRSERSQDVKLVCLEILREKGAAVPSQIKSVPTLITMPEKQVLSGKAVFDYLLLPGKGKLLMPVSNVASNDSSRQDKEEKAREVGADPEAFTFGGFGDAYTNINHQGSIAEADEFDKVYTWTAITDQEKAPISVSSITPEDTRPKKNMIDLDTYKMQRDMDLQQSDINTNVLIPPSFTR